MYLANLFAGTDSEDHPVTGGGSFEEGTTDCAEVIDATGLADIHAHFRDPGFTHKEDIDTDAAAKKRPPQPKVRSLF